MLGVYTRAVIIDRVRSYQDDDIPHLSAVLERTTVTSRLMDAFAAKNISANQHKFSAAQHVVGVAAQDSQQIQGSVSGLRHISQPISGSHVMKSNKH
jgi:hypothetical protein